MSSHLPLFILAFVVACGEADKDPSAVDNDGDGFSENQGDCDDKDPTVYPEADELCDGIDNDCDRGVDEPGAVDGTPYYLDQDGDGYGAPEVATTGCSELSGYLADNTDCDDSDPNINPRASEYCNNQDDDCDGDVDEDNAVDADDWYQDSDGDGYGNPSRRTSACERPDGYTSNSSDCDDDSASINPRADEVCDGEDNDCDGFVDTTGDFDQESAIWGDVTLYFEADTFYGTLFEAEEDLLLKDFSMVLAAISSVSGQFRVFEYDGSGSYELVASESVYLTGDSNFYWYTAEDLDVTMTAGGKYIMGYGSSNDRAYYPGLDDAANPTQAGLTPRGYTQGSSGTPDSITVGAVETDYTLYQQVTVEKLPAEDRDDDLDGVTPFCGDCDDDDIDAYPDAPEICGDGVDQDCDGADEPCDGGQDSDTGTR